MRYIPVTEKEREEMLKAIGVAGIEDLFSEVPSNLLYSGDLPLPRKLAEADLLRLMKNLAEKNTHQDSVVSFLGAGVYDHLIPAAVKHIVSRGEFLTAYTPYQAEISQGVLQAIFEFQTHIAELTGLEVANASMYDGATALAEAALMACNVTNKSKILLPATLHPQAQEVVKLYLKSQDIEVLVVPYDEEKGICTLENYKTGGEDIAGVVIQQPNFFGLLEEVEEIASWVKSLKGLLIMMVDPLTLGILKSPKEYGADIAVGDGQSLGNSPNFGGPGFGFFACSGAKLIRRIPGRIVGETQDQAGKKGYVLTLQTREQHIRREKATSNICSNQALNALAANVYLSLIGKEGLREAANLSLQKAHYLKNRLVEKGFTLPFSSPFFREFVLQKDVNWEEVNLRLLDYGYLGGLPLGTLYPNHKDCALFAVTEARTIEEMDHFVEVLGGLVV